MGLFGGSKSSSSSSSNAEDNRIAAADSAIVAQGGAHVTVNDLSEDALDDLLDGGVAVFEAAGGVARGAVSDATHLGERALETAYDSQSRSLATVDDAVHDSLDLVSESTDRALSSVDDANANLTDLSKRALDDVTDSTANALGFASDATSGLYDVVGQALGLADSSLTRAYASTPGGGVDVARDIAKYIVPVALIFGAVILFRGVK